MDVDSLEDAEKLTDEQIQYKLKHSRDLLEKSGAHYVIDELSELPDVIAEINMRLARGDAP